MTALEKENINEFIDYQKKYATHYIIRLENVEYNGDEEYNQNGLKSLWEIYDYVLGKGKDQKKSFVIKKEWLMDCGDYYEIDPKCYTVQDNGKGKFEINVNNKKQVFYVPLKKNGIRFEKKEKDYDNLIPVSGYMLRNVKKNIDSIYFTNDFLYPNKKRYDKTIKYKKYWNEFYKKHESLDWKADEIHPEKDAQDFDRISKSEKRILELTFGLFSCGDETVSENLETNFIKECNIYEIQMFYKFQNHIETVHNELYNKLIEVYSDSKEKMEKLFSSVKNNPHIKKKMEYINTFMKKTEKETNIFNSSYPIRLIAFACLEGITFCSSFAYILYFKNRDGILGEMLRGNEFVQRDEFIHVDGACEIGKDMRCIMPPQEVAHRLIMKFYDLEVEFAKDALNEGLVGFTLENMIKYIKHISNALCRDLGYDVLFPGIKNPFPWMIKQNIMQKTNGFEERPTEYHDVRGKSIDFESIPKWNQKKYQEKDSKTTIDSLLNQKNVNLPFANSMNFVF